MIGEAEKLEIRPYKKADHDQVLELFWEQSSAKRFTDNSKWFFCINQLSELRHRIYLSTWTKTECHLTRLVLAAIVLTFFQSAIALVVSFLLFEVILALYTIGFYCYRFYW